MKNKLTALTLSALFLFSTPAWSDEATQLNMGLAANYATGTVNDTDKTYAVGSGLRIEIDAFGDNDDEVAAYELGARLNFGLASLTDPSGDSSPALDIGAKLRFDGGLLLSDGCGLYLNGGGIVDVRTTAVASGPAQVPNPYTLMIRGGLGLACSGKNAHNKGASLVLSPYAALGVSGVEIEDKEEAQGAYAYGGRANVIFGKTLGFDGDFLILPNLDGMDLALSGRVMPADHLAIGADVGVSQRTFAGDKGDTLNVQGVRGTVYVGGAF